MAAGRPRKFESPEQLEQLFFDYIDYCDLHHRFTNIAGFVTYLNRVKKIKVCRDTYYAYASEYEEYSDIIKSIDDALEDAVLNNTSQKDLIKITYLNSRHCYSTKLDINNTNINANLDASKSESELAAEIEALQKKLKL